MRKTEEILRSLLHQKGMDSQEDISEFLETDHRRLMIHSCFII